MDVTQHESVSQVHQASNTVELAERGRYCYRARQAEDHHQSTSSVHRIEKISEKSDKMKLIMKARVTDVITTDGACTCGICEKGADSKR